MKPANNAFLPVYELVGQVMTDLGAHYEILILRFGEYEIHVSCFARILHNGKILLTTQDYQSWDENDHKHNDMYLNIAKHGATLIGQKKCWICWWIGSTPIPEAKPIGIWTGARNTTLPATVIPRIPKPLCNEVRL